MTHLFKLKKDGQENYIKFSDDRLWYSGNNEDWFECNENFDVTFWLRYDSIHPFVCPDKHGKDVFADAEIKMFSKQYKVVWDEREFEWFLEDEHKARIKLSYINKNNIELIEEKEWQ